MVAFLGCKQRNFKFLIIGMCFSCQNTPISMPNMNIDRTIKKLVIFGGARELKMGVVSFNNFPSTFLLRTFFWCYSIGHVQTWVAVLSHCKKRSFQTFRNNTNSFYSFSLRIPDVFIIVVICYLQSSPNENSVKWTFYCKYCNFLLQCWPEGPLLYPGLYFLH